jgi:riboflavin kinase/FMN adenylyltransferase
MKIVEQFLRRRVSNDPCLFTFGNFDGVHLGHKMLFQNMKHDAAHLGYKTVLLTFTNHPTEVLSQTAVSLLTTKEHKLKLLKPFDFDFLIFCPFTKELSSLSPDAFVETIQQMFAVRRWLVGDDVTFGKNRAGNKEFLLHKGQQMGFSVGCIQKVSMQEEVISSSLIRRSIEQGDLLKARKLLGRPFSQMCTIHEGIIDGTRLCLPPDGVWEVKIASQHTHVRIDKKQIVVDTALSASDDVEIEFIGMI